jgi:hypothetical protein
MAPLGKVAHLNPLHGSCPMVNFVSPKFQGKNRGIS